MKTQELSTIDQKVNPYRHPKREELQIIFGISSSKANLYKRKAVLADIKALEDDIVKWESISASSPIEQQWFPNWALHVKYKRLDKFKKQHNFLKKYAKRLKEDNSASVENSDRPEGQSRKSTPVFIEYDKEAINQIPIKRILDEAGIESHKIGINKERALCPFHSDRSPSLVINTDGNYVHCFSCNTSADVIKLYQHIHSCDFVTALKELNDYI